MTHCPGCGICLETRTTLKVSTKKQRPRKDPNEPMTSDQFIEGCWSNKQRHIRIIGHYADELKLNGEYKTRGQWNEFMKRNVRPATDLAKFDDGQISEAMTKVNVALRSNGGYMDKFTLETVYKFLVK